MGKWWNQAAEIDRLERELDFSRRQKTEIESLLEREEQRNALLEKEVRSERNKKDKVMLRYGDQMSKQQKLPAHFVADADETPAPVPEPPSIREQERLEWAAMELRQNDLDNGMSVESLEHYVKMVTKAYNEDPSSVFPNG